MLVKTVALTSKGQMSLPADVLRSLNLRKGAQLLLVQEGDRILLTKASAVGKRLVEDLGGWEALGLGAFQDVWDNDADAVWDDA